MQIAVSAGGLLCVPDFVVHGDSIPDDLWTSLKLRSSKILRQRDRACELSGCDLHCSAREVYQARSTRLPHNPIQMYSSFESSRNLMSFDPDVPNNYIPSPCPTSCLNSKVSG